MSTNGDIVNVTSVQFKVLGNDDVKRISVLDSNGIIYPDTYDNSEPKIGGIIDPRLGVTDQFMLCSFCKSNYMECPGHFGHIKLAEPVFHFGFIHYVKNVLSCVCFKTCKLLVSREDISKKVINNKNPKVRFNEIKALCAGVKVSPYSGIPCPSLKVETKKNMGTIQILAEYTMNQIDDFDISKNISVDNISETKKKVTQILTAADCYYILRNISDEDCGILGISRPENMIILNFPVPPVAIRPSLRGDFTSMGYSEHGTTHKLSDIVKFNNKLGKEKEKSLSTNDNSKYLKDYQDCLQYHVATFFDNESTQLPRSELKSGGNAAKSITSRFKGGKTGRIRGNLQGKRVDFSARTVITSDPNNNVDELGVPLKIVMIITYPEIVTDANIDYLRLLIKNGRSKYPGANFIENTSIIGPNGKPVKIDLGYKNEGIKLEKGWIVHRHLQNGDIVLFNRQPSLHKMSMMAHKVRVIENQDFITFRLNVTATTPYNADFDGDEMNLFAPQSEQSKIELMILADIKNHIISPKDSKPIINLKQDSLLASYKFTSDLNQLTWKETMNLLACTSVVKDIFADNVAISKKNNISGRDVFSLMIPDKVNLTNGNTVIKNGQIVSGLLAKKELGGTKNNIPHLIIDSYDKEAAANFMDNTQRITSSWLMNIYGFCVGLGDAIVSKDLRTEFKNFNRTKILEMQNLITENENSHILNKEIFEQIMFREMNNCMTTHAKKLMKELDINNNFFVMIESGSKGKDINMGMIMGCIGQAAFGNKLMEKRFNNRTLSHFAKHDDSASARGFINNGYIDGSSATEFFFHQMDGRVGVIDTAIKTADTGYMQKKTIKATEDVFLAYDGTVRNSINGVVQFVYGDNSYDTSKQMQVKSELIMMDNDTVKEKYMFSESETKLYGFDKKDNKDLYQYILFLRDTLRGLQKKTLYNSKKIIEHYNLPFNLQRVVSYHVNKVHLNKENQDGGKSKKKSKAGKSIDLTPKEILDELENFLTIEVTNMINVNKEHVIKRENEKKHKLILRILLFEYLAPKRVLVEYKIGKDTFKDIMDDLTKSFNKNLAQSCEMVGILAAQSIGEPLTQFTLNTFHSTGVSDVTSNMSAMVRIKEIISYSKNIKAPFMKIYLEEEFKYDEEKAKMLSNVIENTMLSDITVGTEIYFEPDYKASDSIHNRDKMNDSPNNIFFATAGTSNKNVDIKCFPWVYRFVIDREALLNKDISLLDIKTQFIKVWNETYTELKGFKKREKDVICKVTNICILSTLDNDELPVVHIRLDLKEYDYQSILDLLHVFNNTFKVKGIDGIKKALVIKEIEKTFDKDGKIVEKNEFLVTTIGINLDDIFFFEGIDAQRTISNDIVATHKIYGIEGARAILMKEMNEIFSSQGQDINYQHLAIIVDIMTQNGGITPLNRYGINKLETDPLSRASFEKTIEQLLQAAIFNEKDKVNSVSSRIIAGRAFRGGTGMVDLMVDVEKLENTEFVDIVNDSVSLLTEDPFINELFK